MTWGRCQASKAMLATKTCNIHKGPSIGDTHGLMSTQAPIHCLRGLSIHGQSGTRRNRTEIVLRHGGNSHSHQGFSSGIRRRSKSEVSTEMLATQQDFACQLGLKGGTQFSSSALPDIASESLLALGKGDAAFPDVREPLKREDKPCSLQARRARIKRCFRLCAHFQAARLRSKQITLSNEFFNVEVQRH